MQKPRFSSVVSERLLATPTIAIEQCKKQVQTMFDKTIQGVKSACELIGEYSERILKI